MKLRVASGKAIREKLEGKEWGMDYSEEWISKKHLHPCMESSKQYDKDEFKTYKKYTTEINKLKNLCI